MTESVYKKRLGVLRKELKKLNLDAVLVTKKENYTYLSGFTGSSAWLLISQDTTVLFTDFRYTTQAEKQASGLEIVTYKGSITKSINDVIEEKHIELLGFEDTNLTYNKYLEYKEKLLVKELVPIKDTVDTLRMVKDSGEIKIIKEAVRIADKTFSHILAFLKPGVMEVELASEMEYFMRKNGATGSSFESIVASGYRSALPHGVASVKKLEKGDAVTFDFGAVYQGYCSDMTRTVFLGEPSPELHKIYRLVLEAQSMAETGVKKGASGKNIDMIARGFIARNGYGDNFGHGLGHGVGLEIHEEPRLSMSGANVMKNGMVVTVEPGIYVEGLGGVRIEDIVVVKNDTPVILTKSSKDMIVI